MIVVPLTASVWVIVGEGSHASEALAIPAQPESLVAAVHPPQGIETFAGQVMTGGVVSLTVMVCEHEAELPQLSVADHVRVIVLWQLEPGFVCVSPNDTPTAPLQLSLAVIVGATGTEPRHW